MIFDIATPHAALALASRHAREAAPHETGGILIGWREGKSIVVDHFLLVPDSTAAHGEYWRRHSEASNSLKEYLDAADDSRLGYVGEWHSHPRPSVASATDIRSITAIVKETRSPVALIVLVLASNAVTVTAESRVGSRHAFGQIKVRLVDLTTT